jgi:UDP-N-acetylglucosamine 1-carboxyvinyltransferase
LRGADIRVPDLRGGFSHIVAALTAEGISNVSNVQLISRGYEHFLDKLTALGAQFTYSE